MSSAQNFYLERFAFRESQIAQSPAKDLGIIVVIPCHNEPDLDSTLNSLYACDRMDCAVEIIVVINNSETATEEARTRNLETLKVGQEWAQSHNDEEFQTYFIEEFELPKKHAGVGLARKIGMDEAVARFHAIDNDEGIIVCFDADCSCSGNYLTEIEQHFIKHPKTPGCSIHYEHPTGGDEFTKKLLDGIINYELFLRYYNQAQALTGYPGAFHTVGSSMAVRSWAYQKQGGMNKRKAGEDFYFIHKIIALGNFTELKSACVIPSPRTSDRVPFGTGKAMQDWLDEGGEVYFTYDLQSFLDVKTFFSKMMWWYSDDHAEAFEMLSPAIKAFLSEQSFEKHLTEIKANSSQYETFESRFYAWFNAFRILKFVHFARDNFYAQQSLLSQVNRLAGIIGIEQTTSVSDALGLYRKFERS